jgi:hypothetical protein
MILCFLASFGATPTDGTGVWIDSASYGHVHVVLADQATEMERRAVTLFQDTWERCTGFRPSAGPDADGAVNVWVGASALPEAAGHEDAIAKLGRDGILLRTFTHHETPGLLLAGGPGSGVLYAVYEFFEQRFGVRWLAQDATHTPPAPDAVAGIDYTYAPPFAHRDLHAKGDRSIFRLDSPFRFGIHGHSLYNLLPPEKYFAEHPEYYAEINGKRIAPAGIDWRDIDLSGEHPGLFGQLCMSNPAVAEAIAAEIDVRAKQQPEFNAWSVCQMDWGNYCQCAECKAIDEREGTPMGSLLTGINRVAELVERDHPGHYILTYAYTFSRKPPATLTPRDNVIIQLCNIECDFARPLDDPESPINKAFVDDYKTWSKLTNNLFLYDYPVNFWRYQMPHPIFPVFGPNMALYADQQSLGVFQLSVNEESNSFGYLTIYMLSKLMWNPRLDAQAVQDEFVDLYYGKAAPYIKEYIALSVKTLKESGIELSIYDRGGWMTHEYIAASEELFQKALAAAETEEIRRRVDRDYLQVQFAGLDARPELIFTEDTVTLKRPDSISPEGYLARLEAFDIPEMGENQPRERVVEYYGGSTAARTFTCELVTIENDAYMLWLAPALQGSVLRFQDKRNGHELLRGYKDFGVFPGLWQDWVDRDTRAETAAADVYTLVEHDRSHAIIEATLDTGLVVRRTMRLSEGNGPLEVELTLHNPTDAPVPAKVKYHPEFYCSEAYAVPEIWLEKTSGWVQLNADDMEAGPVGFGFLFPEGAKRWAFHLPQKKLTFVNEFSPDSVEELLYYYNTNHIALQINLELLPPRREPLAPGASRAIKASYWTTEERPWAIDN